MALPSYEQLVQLFAQTMLADAQQRREAEALLRHGADAVDQHVGLIPLLLRLSCDPSQRDDIRCASAIFLKNCVRENWNENSAEHPINAEDRNMLMHALIPAAVEVRVGNVRRSLAKAVSLIAAKDFPSVWPGALDQAVGIMWNALRASTADAVVAALTVSRAVFERYGGIDELTEELKKELLVINASLTEPLMRCMQSIDGFLQSANDRADQRLCTNGLTLALEMYSDITHLDMGEEHEAHYPYLMDLLRRCLQRPGNNETELLNLKRTAMRCISTQLERFDEDFAPYASYFLEAVWTLLQSSETQAEEAEDFAVVCLQFLTTACWGGQRQVLEGAINPMIKSVVVPCILIRDEDVELFQTDPYSYMQRDVEGSDLHTKRRSACELLRAMNRVFGEKASSVCVAEIPNILARGDPRSITSAISLITAAAVSGVVSTHRGAQEVSIDESLITNFFATVVWVALQDASRKPPPEDGMERAMLTSECVKFVTTFRTLLPPPVLADLLPVLAAVLSWRDPVTSSYAAHAVDKIVTMELPRGGGGGAVSPATLAAVLPRLLENLARHLTEDRYPSEYVAHAAFHILRDAPHEAGPYVPAMAAALAAAVERAGRNPTNAAHTHGLFEAIAALLRCDGGRLEAVEYALWGPITTALATPVTEFVPYVLQILAVCLMMRREGSGGKGQGLPPHFRPVVEPLLSPALYEAKGNVPAAARLLAAVVRVDPAMVHQEGLTPRVLGVAQSLVGSRMYDHEGMRLLAAVVEGFPIDAMRGYLGRLQQMVLTRLQQAPTPKYSVLLVSWWSIVVVRYGAEVFVDIMQQVQQGLIANILQRVWAPNASRISSVVDRRCCALALVMLVRDASLVRSSIDLAALLLGCAAHLLCSTAGGSDAQSHMPRTLQSASELRVVEGSDGMANAFANVFLQLQGAIPPPIDVCGGVDVQEALAAVVRECHASNAAFGAALSHALPREAHFLIH